MINLRIVRATPDDVPDIAPLFDAYRRFYRQKSNVAGAKRFLKQRLSRNESVIFLAMVNERAVGFAQLYPSFSSIRMKRLWILYDLFVSQEARRGGVGTALLEESKQLAKRTGAAGLVLQTGIMNRNAQGLYEKSGWKRDTAFYSYYLNV